MASRAAFNSKHLPGPPIAGGAVALLVGLLKIKA